MDAKIRVVWLVVECPHCNSPQVIRKHVLDNKVLTASFRGPCCGGNNQNNATPVRAYNPSVVCANKWYQAYVPQ